MPIKKKSHKGRVAAEIGAGAVLAAAAVAGAYFLYGKDGAKNRKAVKSWALKARAEALEKLENLKEMSEPAYHRVVDEVSRRYAKLPAVDRQELKALEKELKGYWKEIKKHKVLKPSR